jgi:phosphopantetheine adenylyltransferase
MAIPRRGLNNIRTLSGRVDQVALPYRAYMQITCLEMEKARRDRERESANKRVREIDARLREIAKDQQELLHAVANPKKAAPSRLPGIEVKPAPPRSAGGFRIRY